MEGGLPRSGEEGYAPHIHAGGGPEPEGAACNGVARTFQVCEGVDSAQRRRGEPARRVLKWLDLGAATRRESAHSPNGRDRLAAPVKRVFFPDDRAMKNPRSRFLWFAIGLVGFAIGSVALAAVSSVGGPEESHSEANFEEVSDAAGLGRFRNVSGGPEKDFLLESVGGGVAVFDYDVDGWLDVYLVSGATFQEWEDPQGPRPKRSRLFRNQGDGTFQDVTVSSGLAHWSWGMGAAAADYDNDGDPDLYLTRFGRNALYRNHGDGTFTEITGNAGVAGGGWSTGAAWGDYDRDGHLDLYVARYVDFNRSRTPTRGSSASCEYRGIPVHCGPKGLQGMTGVLYHNNGDGTFTDVSRKAMGPVLAEFYGFTPLWFDGDNDGWPDLFVANDSTPNLLYRNRRDGTFEEVGAFAGCAYSRDGRQQAGMGADFGDYNQEGRLAIFVTNFSDDYNTLYRNLDAGHFGDVTQQAALVGGSWKELGWAAKFFDYDLDGWLDLFVTNGHIYPEVDQHRMNTTFRQPARLFGNRKDGTFQDVSARAGIEALGPESGRGAAFGDLDNDGDLDVVINNLDGAPWLLRCHSPIDRHWILLHLQGTRSNRDAIGARLTLRAGNLEQMQEIHQSGGFLSSNDLRAHFGLGHNERIDELEIRWPSGRIQRFSDIATRQIVWIREGENRLRPESERISE